MVGVDMPFFPLFLFTERCLNSHKALGSEIQKTFMGFFEGVLQLDEITVFKLNLCSVSCRITRVLCDKENIDFNNI
jgi:hypothetical protein